jgi:agmatine deiminase
MVLEGGSIDVNGQDIVLTTEACLLDPRRNPQITREDVERRLQQMLSAQLVVWLEGFLAGDDTDGHIDQLARFVGPNRIAVSFEENTADVHYPSSQRLWALLSRASNLSGGPFELVKLPGPAVLMCKGERLPAGYANFYIANQVVLVPQYGVSRDQMAVGVLQELFPDRMMVPIDCRAAVEGLGAIHCLTQQVPRPMASMPPGPEIQR